MVGEAIAEEGELTIEGLREALAQSEAARAQAQRTAESEKLERQRLEKVLQEETRVLTQTSKALRGAEKVQPQEFE